MKVSAPATIANFGPGFDVFGLCLDEPKDIIEVKESDEVIVEVDGFNVPEEPEKNVASVSALALLKMLKAEIGFKMKVKKGIRPKSGLGSSGASALGGALAMAKLLGIEDKELIIKAALEGERIASGSAHGDNVVPSLFGGFTILKSLSPLEVFKLDVNFKLVIVLPEVEVSTKKARAILPRYVPLSDAVRNLALASALISALKEGDLKKAGKLLDDYLAIPYRKLLMPWFDKVRKAALESGAYGVSLSGSGPSMFALGEDLRNIGKAMVEAFENEGIRAEYFITKVGGGARCLGV
ncbi:homoserine kinase [Thermococcus sp. M39]|uniref:homoserine kinase n=1 Tax=unclassified Thermococcus TaxID=2627626 RepID=UPI001439089B|nr:MULTISPECIES: homoserine kinase [unclassified Thermococcus]NJE07482.1 homoserine kinase [Thermococcus sp. M39]NJE12385.1 homoserine kinase [Thermococcus sp. LS2]